MSAEKGKTHKFSHRNRSQTPPSRYTARRPSIVYCRNCYLQYKGFYCPRCGQKANTKRFTMKVFFVDSFVNILDIERGAVPMLLRLMRVPGKVIREYIEGKRIDSFNPARFLLVSGALATYISLRYHIFQAGQEDLFALEAAKDVPSHWIGEIKQWYWKSFKGFWPFANEYTTMINIIAIPVFAIFSLLLFRKYNYVENIIINTYIVSIQMMLLLLFLPFLEIFPSSKGIMVSLYTILTVTYNIWCYAGVLGNITLHSCATQHLNLVGGVCSAIYCCTCYLFYNQCFIYHLIKYL